MLSLSIIGIDSFDLRHVRPLVLARRWHALGKRPLICRVNEIQQLMMVYEFDERPLSHISPRRRVGRIPQRPTTIFIMWDKLWGSTIGPRFLSLHISKIKDCYGGEGGIRTPDRLAPMPHFECGAFDHSATSPGAMAGDLVSPRSGRVLGEDGGPDKAVGPTNSAASGREAGRGDPPCESQPVRGKRKVGPPDAVNTGGPVPSIKMLAGSAASRPARAAGWTLAIRLGSAMRTRF
jgi:hypothetical protein